MNKYKLMKIFNQFGWSNIRLLRIWRKGRTEECRLNSESRYCTFSIFHPILLLKGPYKVTNSSLTSKICKHIDNHHLLFNILNLTINHYTLNFTSLQQTSIRCSTVLSYLGNLSLSIQTYRLGSNLALVKISNLLLVLGH